MLSSRRRALAKARNRTDLAIQANLHHHQQKDEGQHIYYQYPSPQSYKQQEEMYPNGHGQQQYPQYSIRHAFSRRSADDARMRHTPTTAPSTTNAYYDDDDVVESHWVLRNRRLDRDVVQQAVQRATRTQPSSPNLASRLISRRQSINPPVLSTAPITAVPTTGASPSDVTASLSSDRASSLVSSTHTFAAPHHSHVVVNPFANSNNISYAPTTITTPPPPPPPSTTNVNAGVNVGVASSLALSSSPNSNHNGSVSVDGNVHIIPSVSFNSHSNGSQPSQSQRNSISIRRSRDRGLNFRRTRRSDQPVSYSSNPSDVISEPNSKHHSIDSHTDHHWRIPLLRSPRKLRILSSDDHVRSTLVNSAHTPWSHPTPEHSDLRPSADRRAPITPTQLPSGNNHHPHHRSDRRTNTQTHSWREDVPHSSARDRVAKRLVNNGARWRGLLARKDLVDVKADAYCTESNEDITPRSSFDIEEATSFYSWDADPPSTSVRGWRSNHSLSYRPKPNDRPRHIRVIGRQCCINDLTDIVDASNEPCVSYDRQIFDPVSKLWTYVEASQPSSSPWELRTVGSPVTCSVSGTEEAVSTIGRGTIVGLRSGSGSTEASVRQATVSNPRPSPPPPPSAGHLLNMKFSEQKQSENIPRPARSPSQSIILDVSTSSQTSQSEQSSDVERLDDAVHMSSMNGEHEPTSTKRRNSSPPIAVFSGDEEARRLFMTAREKWLGYSRKSIYGPANLEAVIFASELDDAEAGALRRASMV